MEELDIENLDENRSPRSSNYINISDVIEVLEADDPFYAKTVDTGPPKVTANTNSQSPPITPARSPQSPSANSMYNNQAGGQPQHQTMGPPAGQGVAPPQQRIPGINGDMPYVRITEQPAPKSLRFRYECEGRSAGSIPGVNSTQDNKTYPEIQIMNYNGPAIVVVSCVTKDAPYRAHPHNLVGREGCRKGVCTMQVPPDTMRVQFPNLGIQCVKKKEIDAALTARNQIRVDPFRQGFKHIGNNSSIDLNAVRLCFQVFIADQNKGGKCSLPLQPIVSDIIYDKKAISELSIIKLSTCYSFVDGGRTDMIILCEKVAKEDISVRFFETDENGAIVWDTSAELQPSQVWKQVAIWFKTPRYRTLDVKQPVKCFIQLVRPSDEASSEPLPFELLPRDTATVLEKGKRKRSKFDDSQILSQLGNEQENVLKKSPINVMDQPIKTEPRDATSSPYNFMGSPQYNQAGSPYPGMVGSPYTVGGTGDNTPQYTPQYAEVRVENIPGFGYTVTNISTTNTSNAQNMQSYNIGPNIPQQSNQFSHMPSTSNNAQMGNFQNNLQNLNQQNFVYNMDTGVNTAELLTGGEQLPDSLNQLSLTDLTFDGMMANLGSMSDSLTKVVNQKADEMLQ